MTRSCLSIISLIIALGGAGCSDSDDADGGKDGVLAEPIEPLTPEQRAAALSRIEDELNRVLPLLDGTPWDERDLLAELEMAAEALVALPDVIGVEIAEEELTATVYLADGFPMVLIHNRPPRPATALRVDESLPRPPARFLPGHETAVAVSYDGGQEVADEISSRLGDSGYNVLPLTPSLADMRNYKDLGFLYVDTHGGSYRQVDITLDGFGRVERIVGKTDAAGNVLPLVYVAQTSTTVDRSVLAAVDDELNAGEIAITASGNALFGWDMTLGITDKFIQANWSFDDGVVVLHTCYGGQTAPFNHAQQCFGNCPSTVGTLDARPMRDAIFNVGANVVMSFDHLSWPTVAAPSIYYFIDRMLGANEEAPVTPPNRPFDWQAVQQGMMAADLMDFMNGRNLVGVTLEGAGGPGVTMAPSLRSVAIADDVESTFNEMTLTGTFGEESGQVIVDGTSLSLTSWEDDRIVAQLPHDVTGPLHVQSPLNLTSNEVPLTQWTGTILFSFVTGDELYRYAEIDVRFRADAHPHRTEVDGPLKHRVSTAYMSGPFVEGDVSALGTSTNGVGVTTVYSGGGPMVIYGKSDIDGLADGTRPTAELSGESGFGGLVEVDPAMNEARLCVWFEAYHTVTVGGEPAGPEDSYFYVPGLLADETKGLLKCFSMTMDGMDIPDGQKMYEAGGTFLQMEWKDFVVESIPTDGTPG